MDPLAAFSVAANVIQFVDFTSKLISGSHEIYKSATGEAKRNSELKTITKSLMRINLSLGKQGPLGSANERELENLCKDCSSVAIDLIRALEQLQIKSSGKHQRWSSFKSALLTVWRQEDIDTLEQRVDSFRQQISMHILVSLR